MKRMLIIVLALVGALLLLCVAFDCLFPDWAWRMVDPARSAVRRTLRKRAKVDLSKYALSSTGSIELGALSCPPLPTNVPVITRLPSDESCSSNTGGHSQEKYENLGYPLRGWVGCYVGKDLEGVHIDALTSDGKEHLASATTNSRGKFFFPDLKVGSYHLVVNSKGLERIDAVVTTTSESESSICLVAAGTAVEHPGIDY